MLRCVALGWSSFGIWNFYFVRWLINIRRLSLMSPAAMVTLSGISGIVAASISIVLLSKFGPAWVMLMTMTAFCLANLLLSTMPS